MAGANSVAFGCSGFNNEIIHETNGLYRSRYPHKPMNYPGLITIEDKEEMPKKTGADRGFLPKMVSYAQNFEDVMLRRALFDIAEGFYVDLGAYHPVVDSVSFWFYLQGWSGVNVEPNPKYFAALCAARPRDKNLEVVIAGRPGTVTLHLHTGGLSTVVPTLALAHTEAGFDMSRTIERDAITLDHLFTEYVGNRTVDFLKIDIEGSEAEVLGATSFEAVRPRILVVEATAPNSAEPAWEGWEPKLIKKGYIRAWFDGLNRFYLREEDRSRRRLLNTPPNVFDRFSFPLTHGRVEGGSEIVAERNRLKAKRLKAKNSGLEGAQPNCILVGGAPRSGTSVLRELLTVHPDIAIFHEYGLSRLFRAIDELIDWRRAPELTGDAFQAESGIGPRALADNFYDTRRIHPSIAVLGSVPHGPSPDNFQKILLSVFEAAFPHKRRIKYIGDKRPVTSGFHEDLKAACHKFADLRVIYIIRNPLDVVNSSMARANAAARGTDMWHITNVVEAAHEWISAWETLRELRTQFGRRIFVLKYEDLCRDVQHVMGNAFEFLGIDPFPIDITPIPLPQEIRYFALKKTELEYLTEMFAGISDAWEAESPADLQARFVEFPELYEAGTKIMLSEPASRYYLKKGFSGPESWGRWTDGEIAQITLKLRKPDMDFRLEFWTARAFSRSETDTDIVIQFGNNRQHRFLYSVPVQPPPTRMTALIDRAAIGSDGVLVITFKILDPKCLGDHPEEETRRIGVGLEGFRLTPVTDLPASSSASMAWASSASQAEHLDVLRSPGGARQPSFDAYGKSTNQQEVNIMTIHRIILSNSTEILMIIDPRDEPISNSVRLGESTYLNEGVDILNFARDGDTIIDLGANIGVITLPAVAAGYKVIAFEASSTNADLLKQSLMLNGWAERGVVENLAIGDREDNIEFVDSGPFGYVKNAFLPERPTISIRMTSLDAYAKLQGLGRIALVKIDIEGSELAALRGMTAALKDSNFPPLYIESNGWCLAWISETPNSLLAFLEEIGYVALMHTDAGLIERRSTDVQSDVWEDYLFVFSTELAKYRFQPYQMTLAPDLEQLFALSSVPGNTAQRVYAARLIKENSLVSSDPRAVALAESLHQDVHPIVREAAAAWCPL